MKKIILMFLFVIFANYAAFSAETATVLKNFSSGSSLDLGVSIPEVQFMRKKYPDENFYDVLVVPGGGVGEVAKPDVPCLGNWILVPNGANVDISVVLGKPLIYDNISIPPVQEPFSDSDKLAEAKFVKDRIVYQTNTNYPGKFAEIEPMKKKRGQSCTILWIYPYQYNPAKKILSVYPDLQVSVNFIGGGDPIPSNLKSENFEKMYKSMAINAEEILFSQSKGPIDQKSASRTGCDLLIIAHDDFENAANTLSDWRNSRGIPTIVTLLSEIGIDPDENDIEDYIDDAYANWNPAPSYLLFIGDSDSVPTWHVNQHPDENSYLTGTDIFYADYDIPADYIADISMGRLSVDTSTQANNIVNRIIAYERRNANDIFFDNAAVAAYFQDNYRHPQRSRDGYADRRFAKTCEDVRNYLVDNSYTVDRIYYAEDAVFPRWWNERDYIFENDTSGAPLPVELTKPTFPWDGDATDITNAVEDGRFLLLHRDHGTRNGWGDPCFMESDVDALDNGDNRPIVWSINCETGWFDNEEDNPGCFTGDDDECFMEHWLRHDTGGAVGLIASTRTSYSGYNDRLVWGWMDAVWPDFIESCGGSYGIDDPIYEMGDVVDCGKVYMMTKYVDDTTDKRRTELEMFHWFGDPTMKIFPSLPENIVLQDFIVEINEIRPPDIATNSIIAAGENTYFTIEGNGIIGGQATFQAGNEVTLSPGFTAEAGSDFTAFLGVPILNRRSHQSKTNSKSKTSNCSKKKEIENLEAPETATENPENQFSAPIPDKFSLSDNYPNPFNPTTTIQFALPEAGQVDLGIYDTMGRLIRTLVEEEREAGYHSVVWNGKDENGKEMSSGVYFYRILAGEYNETKKCLLVK